MGLSEAVSKVFRCCKKKNDGYDDWIVYTSPDDFRPLVAKNNTISTSKYTFWNFIPKNLFEQFHRLALWYFLLVVVLNWVLDIFGKEIAFIPLAFVVLATMSKDFYEDIRRRRSDKEVNDRLCTMRESTGEERKVQWRTLEVGDLVVLRRDENVPADLLLLHSKNDDDVFVETANLDGETNLKQRNPLLLESTDIITFSNGVSTCIQYPQPSKELRLRGMASRESRTTSGGIHSRHASRVEETAYRATGRKTERESVGSRPSGNTRPTVTFEDGAMPSSSQKPQVGHSRSDSSGGQRHSRTLSGTLGRSSATVATVPENPEILYQFDENNMLLRGCTVRNVNQVVGVVLYAGQQTKTMLNSGAAPTKRSKLEKKMNFEIICLAALLFFFCLTCAIGTTLWEEDYAAFRIQGGTRPVWDGFVAFWVSIIVFQVMVPIALYIMLELVKLIVCMLMAHDRDLYDDESRTPMKVRALNIPEDLGQVEYVFSDKTGTLTDNKMVLHSFFMVKSGQFYSLSEVETTKSGMEKLPEGSLLLMQLAVNNTVLPTVEEKHVAADGLPLANSDQSITRTEVISLNAESPCPTPPSSTVGFAAVGSSMNPALPLGKGIKYEAESPDEHALVVGADMLGMKLLARQRVRSREAQNYGEELVLVVDNKLQRPSRYTVALRLKFDHVRKCMTTVIIDGNVPETILVLTKGADSSIAERCEASPSSESRITAMHTATADFCNKGLRTLWYAYKQITREELEAYLKLMAPLKDTLSETYEADFAAASKAIEINLKPLAVTSIEDKLQEKVPETIRTLRKAGIKVWVLTGDKLETAVSVGYSANLLDQTMPQGQITAESSDECSQRISKLLDEYPSKRHRQNLAIVITGSALGYALEPENRSNFCVLSADVKVMICCRVSPIQKSEVVQFVKKMSGALCLAVGDGANDVAMIKEANVGIGISGREGIQAVMASDFAIARFRMLSTLLLVHGHWAYHRLAYTALYTFYKNLIFVLLLFLYHFDSAFSGQPAIDEFALVMYSVIYTALPILIYGIFEQHHSKQCLLRYPMLYEWGRKDKFYNRKTTFLYFLDTIWQACAVYYIPYFAYMDRSDMTLWIFGCLQLFSCVLVVNIVICLDMHYITWHMPVAILISILTTFLIQALVQFNKTMFFFGGIQQWGTVPFWLTVLLATTLAIIPHVLYKFITAEFFPTMSDKIRKDDPKGQRPREGLEPADTLPDPLQAQESTLIDPASSLSILQPEGVFSTPNHTHTTREDPGEWEIPYATYPSGSQIAIFPSANEESNEPYSTPVDRLPGPEPLVDGGCSYTYPHIYAT